MAEKLRGLSGIAPLAELEKRFKDCGNGAGKRDNLRRQFQHKRLPDIAPAISTDFTVPAKVEAIFRDTPAPEIKRSRLNQLLGPQTENSCSFFGRTIVFESEGKEYGMKFAKTGENLSDEWRAMHRTQELKRTLELQSDFPDVSDHDKTGVFRLDDVQLPRHIEIAFARQAAAGRFQLADMKDLEVLVYEHPENHHVYLHDPTVSLQVLRESSRKIVHDLAVLAKNNLFHTAAGNLFHSEDRRFTVNIAEMRDYYWEPTTSSTGCLRAGSKADPSPNMRAHTGLADTKHLKQASELPLYELSTSDYSSDPPLAHPQMAKFYQQTPEFKNLQKSMAERTALLEPLFTWALCLIRNWQERAELASSGERPHDRNSEAGHAAREIEPMSKLQLQELLRDGLASFLSVHTGENEADIKQCLPLVDHEASDDILIDFERLYAQLKFFTDGYIERGEQQPQQVMRKSLAARLSDTAQAAVEASDPADEKYRPFLDIVDADIEKYIVPLFDSHAVGTESLCTALYAFPESDQHNIAAILCRLLDVDAHDRNNVVHTLLDRHFQSHSPEFDPLRDRITLHEARSAFLEQLATRGYPDFDAFLQTIRQDKWLAEDSPLHSEKISSITPKEILTQELGIFCRTYTCMNEKDIADLVKKFSAEYANEAGASQSRLLERFSDEIGQLQHSVRKMALGEAFLAPLQLDFGKVKQAIIDASSLADDTKEVITCENAPQILHRHVQQFLADFSTVEDEKDKTMLGQSLLPHICADQLLGRSVGYKEVISHVFDINFDGNPTGRFLYPKELYGYADQGQVGHPERPDVTEKFNPGASRKMMRKPYLLGYEANPIGYFRGKGHLEYTKDPDWGSANGSFPVTELSTGLIRIVVADQLIRTAKTKKASASEKQSIKTVFDKVISQGKTLKERLSRSSAADLPQ